MKRQFLDENVVMKFMTTTMLIAKISKKYQIDNKFIVLRIICAIR